ncbi:MAG: GNAT family N-acetyltransferase [Spirochaetes bacterium]|nr:GNAT family N-acetyltransferase [Spirochaetota bacterium]
MIITYKEIIKEDYESAIGLWEKTEGMSIGKADTLDSFDIFIKMNHGLSFGAFADGKLIGTALCGTDGRRGYIYHLAVKDDLRGKGIGSKLINLSLSALKQKGIEKSHIFVFKSNETGNAFWKKIGWEKRDDINVFSVNC